MHTRIPTLKHRYKLTSRDMGPVTRCIGPSVPPAQPWQNPLPPTPSKLANFDDVKRPDGGFYIWLKLPCDDQTFAKLLYEQESVLSLPGSYLGKKIDGINPGEGFLRLAVVHDVDTINKAFSAVNRTMQSLN